MQKPIIFISHINEEKSIAMTSGRWECLVRGSSVLAQRSFAPSPQRSCGTIVLGAFYAGQDRTPQPEGRFPNSSRTNAVLH